MEKINEVEKLRKIENLAEDYYRKYRPQMKILEKSPLAKVKKSISAYDVFSLGKMLESFDSYMSICEEEGNVNMLGKIPLIAYDVLSVAYGTSILPIIASVQNVEEERGIVYFKSVRVGTDKGNLKDGDVLADVERGRVITPEGYAGNIYTFSHTVADTNSAKSFDITLNPDSCRRMTIKVNCGTAYGQDDGEGNIVGVGLSGTVDYKNAVLHLEFATAPTQNIVITYQGNYELEPDIPRIYTFWDSKQIMARIYALKGSIGMLQNYALKKRFGIVAEEELANDLVNEINNELGADLIKKMKYATPAMDFDPASSSSVNYYTQPRLGVAEVDHRNTIRFRLNEVENKIVARAGRGIISGLIAGRTAAAYIGMNDNFVKVADGNALGSHVYGTLDNLTVIRVNDPTVLDPNKVIVYYKGNSPFEAPAVYAPYMPLVVTSTLPEGVNPLRQQRAAAIWAGIDVLVPNFLAGFNVVEGAQPEAITTTTP
jgi:hypothetical protein